jgi:hypothetical protein
MTVNEPSESESPELPGGPAKDNYRVAVFGEPDDVTVLKDILTECAGMHPDDALTAARVAPGILPGRFSREAAEAVAAQVERRGIKAAALCETDIPKLDHAEKAHHARCQTDGLAVLGLHAELERLVPWSDVSLLSVGCVPIETVPRFSAESAVVLHAAPNPHRAAVEAAPHTGMALWLACERPWTVYRVLHTQMNYEYLGERKTDSASRNFALFVEDLSQHAPQAYLTPATRAFLQHGHQRQFEFQSPGALRDETILHLLLMRFISSAAAPGTSTASVRAS